MKKDKSYLLLKEPNLYKAFLTLAWPVMLANLLKTLHDLVDTFFIGQMENSVPSQAAIAITWPLLNIFLSLSIGLSVAGVALISQYLGSFSAPKGKTVFRDFALAQSGSRRPIQYPAVFSGFSCHAPDGSFRRNPPSVRDLSANACL